MTLDLTGWRPQVLGLEEHHPATLVVFGPIGHGKSSLINSMCSLWKQASEQVALALPSSHRVTLHTKHIQGQPGFAFLDTQGCEEQNYLNFEFPFLLMGVLPQDYQVQQGIADLSAVVDQHEETADTRQVHGCIFVVRQSFRHLQRSDLMVMKMRQFWHEARDTGLLPLLAVTHMDEVPRSEARAVRESLAALFSIGPADIFLINNAPDPTTLGVKPGFSQEKVIYQLLLTALGRAEEFMRAMREAEEEMLRRAPVVEEEEVVMEQLEQESQKKEAQEEVIPEEKEDGTQEVEILEKGGLRTAAPTLPAPTPPKPHPDDDHADGDDGGDSDKTDLGPTSIVFGVVAVLALVSVVVFSNVERLSWF